MTVSEPTMPSLPSPWIARPGAGDLLLLQAQTGRTLTESLDRGGIGTDFAYSRVGACTMARRHRYMAIVLLGRPSGMTLKSLRRAAGEGIGAALIVVLLPASGGVGERLEHYARGADICLDDWTDAEVFTRIQAWERRRSGAIPPDWLADAGGPRLQIGRNGYVYLGNICLKLSPMPRAVLAAIILAGDEGIGSVHLREALKSGSLSHGAVRVHICAIRKTLLTYLGGPRLAFDAGRYRIVRHSAEP